jgi:hypothetical protein
LNKAAHIQPLAEAVHERHLPWLPVFHFIYGPLGLNLFIDISEKF